MTVCKHELKSSWKMFFIWLICVSGMCFGCILMYGSVEDSIKDMGAMFSEMGAMSAAFGMDRVDITTLTGYFATEVAMIHSLGGAMFAAMLGSNMLCKEEYGHTAEFLLTLPISRKRVVMEKAVAIIVELALFQVICCFFNGVGFSIMKEKMPWKHMGMLSLTQFLLFVVIAALTFCISACSKKNRMGVGFGVALLFFVIDMMCRIIPAIENMKYITPFYFCNATDLFTDTKIPEGCYIVAIILVIGAIIGAVLVYEKKDLAS